MASDNLAFFCVKLLGLATKHKEVTENACWRHWHRFLVPDANSIQRGFLPFKLCKNQLQLSQFDFIQKREENAVLYIAYKIG